MAKRLLTDDYVVNVTRTSPTDSVPQAGLDAGRPGHLRRAHLHAGLVRFAQLHHRLGRLSLRPLIDEPRKDADSNAVFAGKITMAALTRDRTLLTGNDHALRTLVQSGQLMR